MESIQEKASFVQKDAWNVIKKTKVIEIWESIGATINLVGSLKTGLLINNRDIDFHIYTDPFILSDSFSAITRLAENMRIKHINYVNLLETEEQCIEWHAFYENERSELWQIDMIHILKCSPYAEYFENVAQRISEILTQETREAILLIKNSIPAEKKVMGIEIYKSVLQDGVRDIDSFWKWKAQNPESGIITWIP